MASGMATRCTACGTVFRVVQDQLRVSEGWVRCGRCSEVFNAAESLLDLETGAAHQDKQATRPRAMAQFGAPRPAPTPPAPPPAFAPAPVPSRFEVDAPAPAAYREREREPEIEPEPEAMPVVDDAASRFAADAATAPTDSAAPVSQGDDEPAGKHGRGRPATPSFVRQAERAARWRHPRVRTAMWTVGVLGVLGLGAQVLHEYRDLVAARYTALRPALQQGCEWLGCTVDAAHLIDSLVVESSGLVRVEKSSVYKLSVALRNRAALEVALPALELSLTDSQGKLVARRVLRTPELGVKQATLAPGRELTLQATLQAATAPVAGYTIELFYP